MLVFHFKLFLLFKLFDVTETDDVYNIGPVDLELFCVVSVDNLVTTPNIECALITSRIKLYSYAFVVREARCYTCRATDALGVYRVEELPLEGPHFIRGTVIREADQTCKKNIENITFYYWPKNSMRLPYLVQKIENMIHFSICHLDSLQSSNCRYSKKKSPPSCTTITTVWLSNRNRDSLSSVIKGKIGKYV